MINKNIKIIAFIFLSSFFSEQKILYSKCLSEECKKLEIFSINKNLKDKNALKKSNAIFEGENSKVRISSYNFLKKESFELDKTLANLLVSNKEILKNNSDKFIYQIESDQQYFEKDIFYAEGKVKVFLPNGVFKADKVSYDRSKKLFKAYSNINFQKGNQFFKADFLEYNFLNKIGFIKNITGIIDFNSIKRDQIFDKTINKNNSCKEEDIDLINLPSEVDLLASTNERYKNTLGKGNLKFNFTSIKNWRFKSKRIDFKDNKWTADLVEFTNDPYNKPQLIIKSRNFVGEIIDGNTRLTSNSTSINFEDKLTIPIIGKRTINNESSKLRWGIGYESKDKDGLYIMRNFNPIVFNKNISIDFQPYFLLERAIQGETYSFRKKDSSLFSSNYAKDINFSDYFALNSKLKGEFYNWDLDINTDLKTLNPDNFYDGFNFDLNLVKNLFSYSSNNNEEDSCITNSFQSKKSDNLKVDIGFYSVFDNDDIYTSYGTKLVSSYSTQKLNSNQKYELVLDYGEYQGKGKNIENDNTVHYNEEILKKHIRYGVTTSASHLYKVYDFSNNSESYSSKYNFSPINIEQGLFINAKIGTGFYEYSNNSNQSLISFSFGPSISYGSLKRKFLDYTYLAVFPEFINKRGESPFEFDDFNNNSRIKFNFKQQLIGPIILGYQADYNINTNSNEYSTFENKRISLDLSRRAYSLGLSYSQDDQSILLGFELFNFGDTKFNKSF